MVRPCLVPCFLPHVPAKPVLAVLHPTVALSLAAVPNRHSNRKSSSKASSIVGPAPWHGDHETRRAANPTPLLRPVKYHPPRPGTSQRHPASLPGQMILHLPHQANSTSVATALRPLHSVRGGKRRDLLANDSLQSAHPRFFWVSSVPVSMVWGMGAWVTISRLLPSVHCKRACKFVK